MHFNEKLNMSLETWEPLDNWKLQLLALATIYLQTCDKSFFAVAVGWKRLNVRSLVLSYCMTHLDIGNAFYLVRGYFDNIYKLFIFFTAYSLLTFLFFQKEGVFKKQVQVRCYKGSGRTSSNYKTFITVGISDIFTHLFTLYFQFKNFLRVGKFSRSNFSREVLTEFVCRLLFSICEEKLKFFEKY